MKILHRAKTGGACLSAVLTAAGLGLWQGGGAACICTPGVATKEQRQRQPSFLPRSQAKGSENESLRLFVKLQMLHACEQQT